MQHSDNDKTLEEYMQEFFDPELAGIGYLQTHCGRSKFPRISVRLLDQAISKNYLPYQLKDKIIKDPNKMSIFFTRIDSKSPFTRKTLSFLQLPEEMCNTRLFEEFMDQRQDPLNSLVKYLFYLTQQYKTLLNIFHTRNKFKKAYLQKQKRKGQILPLPPTEQSGKVKDNAAFLTQLFNPQDKKGPQNIFNSLNHVEIQSQTMSFHNKSIDSAYLSFDEKLKLQHQRSQQFQKTYMRYIQKLEQSSIDLNEFYEKRKPFFEAKIAKVQENNKMQFEQRRKKNNDKVEKTLEKIKQMKELDIRSRKEQNDELKSKLEQNQENRLKLLKQQNAKQQEKQEEEFYLAQQREQKRQLAISMEQEGIEEILERHKEKEGLSMLHMQRIKKQQDKKRLLKQQIYEKAQEKVHLYSTERQSRQFTSFMYHQDQLQEKLLDSEQQKKALQDSKLKKAQLSDIKVKQNKVKQHEMFVQKIQTVQEKQQEDESKVQKVQFNIANRTQEQLVKNKDRLQKVLTHCASQQNTLEQKSKRILDKLRDDYERLKTIKQEKHELQENGFQNHLEFKKSIENFLLKRKPTK